MSENNLQVDSFYKYLISNGYYFDKELIENYLLSLKVKPFEILTGNSGTGKTKLSQLFAKFINPELITIEPPEDYVKVKGNLNFSSWSNMGWTLEKNYFRDFLPIKEFESKCDLVVDNIPAKGGISLTIQLEYTSSVLKDHLKKRCDEFGIEKYSKLEFPIDILINAKGIEKIMDDEIPIEDSITITQNSNKSAYEDCQWNMDHDFFQHSPFKKGKVDCKIIVDGICSDAKLRVLSKLSFSRNEKLQDYLKKHDGEKVKIELKLHDFNFKGFKPKWNFVDSIDVRLNLDENYIKKYIIVPVGANWTDNTNILGYYNVITEDYKSTPAYELIKKAQNDPRNPYFLILDEMNLSHVERYFADFLSSIESGEEIPLYGNDESLKLPDNLFTIGTVNVDETTYMFSPKVLDRANTIEFDTLTAWDYMVSDLDDDDFKGDIDYLQSPLIDSNISNLNIEDLKEILSEISYGDGNLWKELANELTALQEELKGSSFDFGFRVINEILRFMIVAWRYEESPSEWNNWQRYFDAQIKQKILPKLHGSEKAIGNVLTSLFNLCLEERNNNENPKIFEVNKENSRYYSSALKLQSMSNVLSDQRYVSFIN
ncbi:McrB family protein [Methanobrevibacter sp.]|uniref:McrB family protein n=1 Tax=Methanobrevibacter sp. TaxID=66852 RepID=UPI0025E93B2D|nr:hypothetical protein [Methanobrevibacter sp.]MBQ2832751.1 hypothetical protein [Methanobrevibacter sp.]